MILEQAEMAFFPLGGIQRAGDRGDGSGRAAVGALQRDANAGDLGRADNEGDFEGIFDQEPFAAANALQACCRGQKNLGHGSILSLRFA